MDEKTIRTKRSFKVECGRFLNHITKEGKWQEKLTRRSYYPIRPTAEINVKIKRAFNYGKKRFLSPIGSVQYCSWAAVSR